MNKKSKIFLSVFFVFATLSFLYFKTVKASGSVYYFSNAVNTSPLTLGNYWNDYDATDPATQLPDTSVDEINILPGATYAGDAVFNGSAINEGEITGNAVFNGDLTENLGTVDGIKTRRYTEDITVTRDFVSDGVWTVQADGAVVNLQNATYDENTIFEELNSGSFLYFNFSYATVDSSHHVMIFYDDQYGLDSSKVPSISDYTLTLNGENVGISGVSVSSGRIILNTNVSFAPGDKILLGYVPGSVKVTNSLGKTSSEVIADYQAPFAITLADTDANFFRITSVKNKIYGSNVGSKIVVLDPHSYTVSSHISVGATPEYITSYGNKIYVTNTGDDTLSIIDGANDSLISTIPVSGSGIQYYFYITTAGNKVYLGNVATDTLSIINTDTDTVSKEIEIPGDSFGNFSIAGNHLYVTGNVSGSLYDIDTTTDTVVDTITIGGGPVQQTSVGGKIYVSNVSDDTVSVIDSSTDTVTKTISVGDAPGYSTAIGNKLYVANSNSVSVIDIITDSVVDTLSINSPVYMATFDNLLYVLNTSDKSVKVVDPENNQITDSLQVLGVPSYPYFFEGKLFVGMSGKKIVQVFDTNALPSKLPNLINFTTHTSNAVYGAGHPIEITANFGRELQSGSSMTIRLSTGASINLNSVHGNTLSGTYEVGAGEKTPDLSVTEIIDASVSDTDGHTRHSYDLPSSVGSFTAENSFITRNLGDSKNIEIGANYDAIDVGGKPYQISGNINGYAYVANQELNTVSVVRLSDKSVVSSIAVGSEPYGLATASVSGVTYLYVANTGSDTVSVINTSTNTISVTISVGVKPYYVASVGTKVYVTNGASNTVSVIDANTNTVSATIPVGSYPRGIKAYGTHLYVANYGDQNYSGGSYISVIDSSTDAVTDTIILPVGSDGPRGVNVLGSKVYVANFRSNNVSVIDTNTNTITDTIDVGMGPRGIIGYGTKVYVENFDDGTISVIDTNTNTVTETIDAGNSPAGISVIGSDLYYTRFQDGLISIIDTETGEVRSNSSSLPPSTYGSLSPSSGSSGGGQKNLPKTSASLVHDTSPVEVITTGGENETFKFQKNLKLGMIDGDVKKLQEYLNANGFTLATTGAGSKGNETNKFGRLTKQAVINFQKAKNLVPDGIVGPKTREVLNKK